VSDFKRGLEDGWNDAAGLAREELGTPREVRNTAFELHPDETSLVWAEGYLNGVRRRIEVMESSTLLEGQVPLEL
jgi:hypothetical protein